MQVKYKAEFKNTNQHIVCSIVNNHWLLKKNDLIVPVLEMCDGDDDQ